MPKKYDVPDETLKEIRCWDLKGLSLRVIRKEDGALPKIEGYAAVFNSDSEDMGFVERIKPGAFKEALKRSDARALFNHDQNYILGRQSNGTLVLKEDKKGLFMSVQPPDTQLVRDMVLAPIERGDLTQQSFGFTIEADQWDGLDTDTPTRTILKVRELYDVSPVTYPAYPDTEVGLRTLEEARAAAKKEIPDPPEKITITMGENTFEFDGDDRFDRAAEKITELRSESSPTTPDPDSTDDDPTVNPPSDDEKRDISEFWDKTKKFEEGD